MKARQKMSENGAIAASGAQGEGAGTETAILGGGCFWCLEAVFREVAGVRSVQSGYAGGRLESPSYRQVCAGDSGHAEVVRVEFDPALIDYGTVLEIFFAIHDPTTPDRQGNDVGPQYRSVIFTTTAAQHETAARLVARLNEDDVFGQPVVTEVEAAPVFWPAEAEHHHYFAHHGDEPYCRYVIAPKLAKFRARFPGLRAAANG